jgi:outer membrane protein assembly factor BamB
MPRWWVGFTLAAVVWSGGVGRSLAVALEQVISCEDPAFGCETARLTVGRDGLVYLCSGGDHSFVLRLSPAGRTKLGSQVVSAAHNATANADGVLATANAHFAHQVTLYSRSFTQTGTATDFLVSDQVGWDAPAHVEAGSSGDFFALDQHRDRIVRLSPAGKPLRAYPILRVPAGHPGVMQDFRVCEKAQAFYLLRRSGPLACVGFDGKTRWTYDSGVTWGDGANAGGFDVDDDGHLYTIGRHGEVVHKVSPAGKLLGKVRLQTGAWKPAANEAGWTDLRVHGGAVLLKRRHPTELFQRYDRDTGMRRQVVSADHERLTVSFPERVWTAGQAVPFVIRLSGGAGGAAPRWRVWAAPLGTPDYRELPLAGDQLRVPADCAGVYQLRVTPEVRPGQSGVRSEYGVRTWVDVRSPGARGSATVWTEHHRGSYGRGEEVRFAVRVRTAGAAKVGPVTVRLLQGGRVLAEEKAEARPRGEVLALTLSGKLTAALRPGRYTLVAAAPGLTSVPQPLVIGPGTSGEPFHRVQYGDYGPLYPSASVWEAPVVAAAHADRTTKLGMSLMVDRLGDPNQLGALEADAAARAELDEVRAHLAAGPRAPAPERYVAVPALRQVLSAYSAAGVEQMAILMMNDAGLPLGGPGFDPRQPPQLLDTLTRITRALGPYPAFRGWSWSSNWWVFDQRGAKAAQGPEEQAAYEAALKRARAAGAWDPVLERVSGRRLSFAVEAQDQFNRKLRAVAPRQLVTASAGPHRNVEAYPPVTLGNVDEVDLQAQWEQVAIPLHAPHGVDFYKRPGKRAWTHPEVWNDSGTGDQILPTLFQAVMRGADGVGCSGPVPPWTTNGSLPDDPRGGHYGTASVFRALNGILKTYGPWLATLTNADRVAIVVSGRLLRIDDWGHVMGTHFARLFEAYASCLHAHHPARYVFVEDLRPGALRRFRAVLVVGQTVEPEPELRAALADARSAGVAVFHDGTCRPELVKGFTPLGVSFDQFEKDPAPASDDAAYLRFPAYCRAHVPALKRALDAVADPPAGLAAEEVFLTERRAGDGRFLFVVNNTTPDLEPGHLWRITLAVANRVPLKTAVKLPAGVGAVYDVFAGRPVEPRDGAVEADLRSLPCRVYALLPAPIERVELRGPAAVAAGGSLPWAVRVRAAGGQALRTNLPIRVCLLGADGQELDEQVTVATDASAAGALVVPLDTPAGVAVLEATELFGNRSARLRVQVAAAPLPVGLGSPPTAMPVTASTTGEEESTMAGSPPEAAFGPHVRDVVLTGGGRLAVLSTMNWDHNLYGLDVDTGRVRWRQRAGHYFTFAPQPLRDGFAVQGFDFCAAEGYHLYLAGTDGGLERRFALYGLPRRQIHRFVPGIFTEPGPSFAVGPDGSWVATAGDLGLAVWQRDGKLLWSQDWWKAERHPATLAALGSGTLLVVEGLKATAYEAATGRQLWQLELAATGAVRAVRASADGQTCALLATTAGGRVFVLRAGRVIATFPTAGRDLAVSADGSAVAVVVANQLKLYSVTDGLRWVLPGDDSLHSPRFAPDGRRVAVGSALGTIYVVGAGGEVLLERDLGALPVPAWLPDGDLLLGTWMGTVCRLDGNYAERWRTRLQPSAPDRRGRLLAEDPVPTTRINSWGNAEARPEPLTPNLLTPQTVLLRFESRLPHVQLVHPFASLVDGRPDAPPSPWLPWWEVGLAAELSPVNALVIDTFRTRLRVRALTFVEDPEYPESWLRDAALEYWDAAAERWVNVQPLLSDAPVHTHRLARPVEAARFRIVLPRGLCGNLRLGEVVLHGEKAGPSHPDVLARRPVAVLFDEGEDVRASLVATDLGVRLEGAYAGGRCLVLEKEGTAYPAYQPPFGHALPNWDFEVAEDPQPGQYRYLQFAWRATSPQTRGIALQVGSTEFGQQVAAHCGEYQPADGVLPRKVAAAPPAEWQVVRVDLWEVFRRPVRIQALALSSLGGGAAFDQVLLGRTEKDLPAVGK